MGSLHTLLHRLRHVAGVPSGLLTAVLFCFYLLVNALTYTSGDLWGNAGVWLVTVVSAVVVVLSWKWQRRFAPVLRAAELDTPGLVKLARRRGVVVLVGLDSATPGTTFARLCSTVEQLDYLALVATPQGMELGVVDTLLQRLLPASGKTPLGLRVWEHNEAESMASVESSVAEAIDWMLTQGLHPSQVVVDVTKGRRSMAFGALIAADHAGVEVQYLAAEWHHLDNKPRPGTQDFRVVKERWSGVGEVAAEL